MIPIFQSHLTKEMEEAVIHSLQNEKFILGESVFKFEEEFANYIGTKYAVSLSSGTGALYLSLLSLGITNNSKVVTSTNSFISSANCILMTGATPILSDIHLKDGNIMINTDEKINAIIPIHIYGNPCDYDEIQDFAENKHIPVIEDACQAHGAIFRNKKVGSLGDVGCFSFYPTKNMTVGGDGGMVTTNNDEIAKNIISLRDNGRKTRTEHDKLGFTMRLNTINAAIGRVQLRYLNQYNKRKREIFELYKNNISKDCFLSENPNGASVFHQIVLYHNDRDKIIEHLSKNEIGTSIHYPIPIHKQPLYSHFGFSLPNSEEFVKKIVSLPSYPQLSNDQIKLISEKINEIIN